MKAVKELVPEIAEQTLSGGALLDFPKERNFLKFITGFLRSDAKPENIRLIPKVLEVTDSAAGSAIHRIDGTEIALGDTKTIQDNMKILSQVLENAG